MPDRFTVEDRIAATIDHGVADISLARPEKLNTLDHQMFEAIVAAADWVARREDVRAVVLRGEGNAFCAGLDLSSASEMFSGTLDIANPVRGDTNLYQLAAMVWHDLSVPVIAALHGVAFGGGLQIALGADIRICTANTRLSLMEMRWGIVPDMGASVLLRDLMRPDQIRDLYYTARIIEGPEAEKMGLVTHLTEDPVAEAFAMARLVAENNPSAVRAAKRIANLIPGSERSDALRMEREEQHAIIAGGRPAGILREYLEDRKKYRAADQGARDKHRI